MFDHRVMRYADAMLSRLSHGISALVCMVALSASCAASEVRVEDLALDVQGRALTVTRYAAASATARPAVLMLHGSRGFDVGRQAYARSAITLAERGIDAYLVTYYEPHENTAARRFDGWAETIAHVTTAILQRPEASGRVGLLGFSLGGAVAFAGAGDPRIDAVVVFYGFIPGGWRAKAERLAPLLVLHGDNDSVVPLKAGRELVDYALARGGRAELVVYPGQPHALSAWSQAAATDAIERMTTFFRAELF